MRIFGGKKGTGDGEMAMVHGVAIDGQGRVYATDSDNQRVVVFDAQGKFLKNIAIPGRGGSFMLADGTFYISDVNSGAVAVMKNDQIVDMIKVEGRPHGLAVDPTTGDVYTSSTVATRPGVTKAAARRGTGQRDQLAVVAGVGVHSAVRRPRCTSTRRVVIRRRL